jgi:hypothetical protein
VDGSGLILVPELLALVGLLLQPSLDGFPAVSHVTAHSIADWTGAPVPPAIQGVNGDPQHLREIRKRHQFVTRLDCHDHLLSRGSQLDAGCAESAWQSPERSGKQLGRAARPVEDLPTIT